jgi:hypothetical protein
VHYHLLAIIYYANFISLSFVFLLCLVQVCIVGEKIGEGIGRTRREAQHQAAEMSLRNLASKFDFIWVLRHGNTRTRSFLHRHGVCADEHCPFCPDVEEDLAHLDFECPRVVAFLGHVCPPLRPLTAWRS